MQPLGPTESEWLQVPWVLAPRAVPLVSTFAWGGEGQQSSAATWRGGKGLGVGVSFLSTVTFGRHDRKRQCSVRPRGRGCLLWSQSFYAEFSHSGCE